MAMRQAGILYMGVYLVKVATLATALITNNLSGYTTSYK